LKPSSKTMNLDASHPAIPRVQNKSSTTARSSFQSDGCMEELIHFFIFRMQRSQRNEAENS
jgi:hypothetical protein